MAVTETTTESWGSRLGGSMKGVLVGLGLFVLGFPVLFWNEGNSVKTAKALDEGEGACVSVESNERVDPELEGKLVHLSGKADTKDVLADEAFGVSATALALARKVEMFQWQENCETVEKKNVGGSVTKTKTYTYEKVWSERPISSSAFKEAGHENPDAVEFPSREQRAGHVRFGAFRLNERQIARIGGERAFEFPSDFTCRVARVQMQGATIYVPNRATRENALNVRDVVAEPRIGDMRVSFSVIYPHEISLVAQQRGDTFVGYVAQAGKKVDLLKDGVVGAVEMFADARDANTLFTWALRVGGFLLMFFGLSMALKPLSVLADVLPVLGDLVGMGTGLVAGLVSLVCALVTVAIAWIFYRPVLGVALLAVAAFFAWKLVARRRAAKAAKVAVLAAFAFLSATSYAGHRVTQMRIEIKDAEVAEVAAAAEAFKALGSARTPALWVERCGAETWKAVLKTWPNAVDVGLRHCVIDDLTPVAAMPALEKLSLYGSKVRSFAPLAAAKRLKLVDFYAVQPIVPGEDCYSSLGTLNQVTKFHGGLTKMTSLAWLREVPQAEEVKIFSEKIDDFTPLASLPNLRYVRVWNQKEGRLATPFGSLKVLAGAKKLVKLELPGSFVTDLEAVAGLPSLERLDLSRVTGVTSIACLEACPKLKRVDCPKNVFPADEIAALDATLKARGKGNRVNVR